MSLSIYLEPSPTTNLSQDGFFTNPFALSFDGRIGGFKERKLYIRNDDPTFYYTGIVLSLLDTEDPTITDRPTEGFSWKLSYGDTKPTYNDWLNTAANNSLSIPVNLGSSGNPNTSTYLPFWVFIQVAPHTDVQVFTGVQLLLEGTEVLV